MRSLIVALAVLCAPGLAAAQSSHPAIGVYGADGAQVIVAHLSDIDALTTVDFPSGRVRALRPVGADAFAFGSRVGGTDDAGRIAVAGDMLTRTEAGVRTTSPRIALRTRDVRFASGDHALAGTLTLPPGAGPFPGVVLLHGGGPQTRDFWWVAPFFAARGVAVLAYDKQGVGDSTGDWRAAGLRGLAQDAVAAVRFLRGAPEVDARRVGLYGSSNGGWVAPLAAGDSDARPAFVIARSASALPELENIALEVAGDLDDAGFGADAIAAANALYALRIAAVKTPTQDHWERYRLAVEANAGASWFARSRLPSRLMAWRDENIPTIQNAVDYWRRNWIEPPELWEKIDAPVLVQIGASDRSIPGPESARRLTDALRNNPRATVRLYADADHPLFANPSGRARDIPAAQGFAPGYLEDLDAFIRAQIIQSRP